MDYFAQGSPATIIDTPCANALLDDMLAQFDVLNRVLIVPPDITRRASGAGELTVLLYHKLAARGAHVALIPALGTHAPMTAAQLDAMFPGLPHHAFHIHRWREDLAHLGDVPASFISDVTDGLLHFPIRCEVNRLLTAEPWDRIFSIGQLMPHEVIGVANHNKNIFVGLGGPDVINKSHFIGAAYGMERIMGRARTPVRDTLNYMSAQLAAHLPISYVLTVRGRDEHGALATRGMFAGDDAQCFERGAALCQQVNINMLNEPIRKAVVMLDADEYSSTWLGNKAIYRTRLAMADDGELIILAPNVSTFGEDPEADRLIRAYGYHGAPRTLAAVEAHEELRANLAAAAHLIHGSTEGRFHVTYCAPKLSRAEIESVGYRFGELDPALTRYQPRNRTDGVHTDAIGEPFFFISNPGQGLWALRSRFDAPA